MPCWKECSNIYLVTKLRNSTHPRGKQRIVEKFSFSDETLAKKKFLPENSFCRNNFKKVAEADFKIPLRLGLC